MNDTNKSNVFISNFSKLALVTFIFIVQARADIFGTDDRYNPKVGSQEEHLAKSVAVGILTSLYEKKENGNYLIHSDNMSDFMCKDERFSTDPSLAYACSGFLVAPDLLLTAGHCSTNVEEVFNSSDLYCDSYAWMFDYRSSSESETNLTDVSPDNIYNCKEIIYAVSDSDEPYRDFALIRLDRDVVNRDYLKMATEDVSVGDAVSMLGSPMGMPTKFTTNAKVLESIETKNVFTTNLDAFTGNSGSAVFNDKNEVVGILVSGSPSDATFKDPILGCERYNYCDEDGENCMSSNSSTLDGEFRNGSDIQKLSKYRDLIIKSILE
jgi:V8-like Glu-specific endopeptidase